MTELKLYHGSNRLLTQLVPCSSKTRSLDLADQQAAVYATPIRDRAVALATRKLIEGDEVRTFLHPTREELVVVNGNIPYNGMIYVYTVPVRQFEPSAKDWQWISTEPVTPLSVEEISNWKDFVRHATIDEEYIYWQKLAQMAKIR